MAALVGIFTWIDSRIMAAIIAGVVIAVHLVPWLADPYRIRSVPGPFFAKFSDVWLSLLAAAGHRSEAIHQLHSKYGTFVRIAPNHISVSDPDAVQVIYGHGSGAMKSDFYDAFVSIMPSVFSTRDRAAHVRKRKLISHIFSQKSVLEFEPHVRLHVGTLINKWDRLCSKAVEGLSGPEGEGGWAGRDGWLWLDALPWCGYLAFDIIGDLAFGSPFGMIHAAKDSVAIPKSSSTAMDAYGKNAVQEYDEIPAVQILNLRGEFSATMGVLSPWTRAIVQKLPWFHQARDAQASVPGMAVVMVAKRLATPVDRIDLLSKLQEGKDDEGKPMGKEELTAEALTQLVAGSDTTANSLCAVIYYLARCPRVQMKLQTDLDDQLGTEDELASTSEQVKRVPYLELVINEALRVHSTSALGLPRVAPEGGLTLSGRHFLEGTVLSVPSYTIHRDPQIWGDDAEIFRPERWFERDQVTIRKTFNLFSFGPRACVGRNIATLEMQIVVSSILRRYQLVLQEDKALEIREGFIRKPLHCRVGIRRRNL